MENEEDDEETDDVPQSLPHLFKGHSRVQSEFQILKFLGKGGFGDVLKVGLSWFKYHATFPSNIFVGHSI